MCKDISWASFGYFIFLVLVIYYGAAGAWLYQKSIRSLIAGNNHTVNTVNLPEELQSLLAEITAWCRQAAIEQLPRSSVTTAIRSIIQKHPVAKSGTLHTDINRWIGVEAEKRCSIRLTGDELEALWKE